MLQRTGPGGRTHHPSQGHRPGIIGHHDHFRRQRPGFLIQGHDPLPLARRSDDNPTFYRRSVEGMQRLTVFDHNRVGSINDRIDRPNAGGD